MTALHYRERTGQGQKVEGSLLSAAMSMLSQEIAVYLNADEESERSESGVGHVYNPAPYGVVLAATRSHAALRTRSLATERPSS